MKIEISKEDAKQIYKDEIRAKIEKLSNVCKKATLDDVLFAFAKIHFFCIDKLKCSNKRYINYSIDTLKYSAEALYKFCQKKILNKPISDRDGFTDELISSVFDISNDLLTYSESITILNLSDKLSIEHKNGKLCIKNELKSLDSIERNKDLKGYLDFCCRVANHTEIEKNKILCEDDFFKFINDEYSMCNDIFIKSVGFSIDKYTNLIKKILTFFKMKLNNIKDFSFDNYGRIELNLMNIAKMVEAFIMPLKEFDSLEKKILDELIMDPKDIDISDTHKFLINWKPLIKYDDKIIFSPDMLLESMNYFIHLKLINDKSVQLIEHSHQKINEVYQRLCSERFVNKISEVAERHNYEVLYKNKDIKISKSQSIGDIDLAIKKDNFVFLIEAKNHSIPLDIYFGDYVKCIEKKKEHDNKWLNHIKERKNYVSMNLNEFGISEEDSFDYIIVTKNPDIVTHFDNYPCLTLIEFDSYLDNSYQCNIKNFFKHFYEKITTDKSISSIPQPSLFFGE